MSLIEQLKRHEGLSLTPYKCTASKTTIGYGRNLDDKGISLEEAEMMLINDIREVESELSRKLMVFISLAKPRQDALVNMGFNLGVAGLLKFNNMIEALNHADYELAAKEMLNSKWAKQVGKRAGELARQMKDGTY